MDAAAYIERLDRLVSIIMPGLFALAVFMILLEVLLLVLLKVKVSHKGGLVSLASAAGVFGFEALADFLFYLALSYWLYEHRLFEFGFAWYVWVFAFVLYDFIFYWSHRLQHEVRFFWCFHSVHHTTQEMRLASAVRGPVIEFVMTPWFFIWMCWLGIHPLMFITVRTFSRIWGVLEHINEKFVGHHPWLNKIFITPDVHRVHHGKNYRYLDMNYSEILSIWDRMFGTYQEYDEKPVYGVLKEINPDNFWEVQTHAWKELWHDVKTANGWRNKLKLLYMPPGWYPDGRDFTAKTLRASVTKS
ncbi:MAG: sterol desaturase family protein [Chitinophagales bacterium]|nr:sterol desaturase family protein [Chitinophagales bacterium]